ncbi:MAG: extracellular matrix/biofilm biosynthesis regulator RemA family protein [Dysosmobacter welbionis]
MKLINIGSGNLVSADRLVAVVGPDSAPSTHGAGVRERGMLIDATYGRKTASIFIMDSDHVVLSALPPERFAPKEERERRIGACVYEKGGPCGLRPPAGEEHGAQGPAGVPEESVFFCVGHHAGPGPGELDGIHYHFMDVESFRKWIAMDQFLEYAGTWGTSTAHQEVCGRCHGGRKDVILDIEIQGAIQVCSKRPDTVRIFIAPPSWAELERRLTERGTDSPEKIQKRLLRAKVEFQTAHTYDYFVINDTVENAVGELNAIITAEHCKPQERMEIISGR